MSQNLRVATWIPVDRINTGEGVVATNTVGPGQAVNTSMAVGGGTSGTGGGGSNTTISTVAPTTPSVGDMWVDISNPAAPQVKVFKQGNAWVVMATGQTLPPATKSDQLLHSGLGPNFDWQLEDTINLGNY